MLNYFEERKSGYYVAVIIHLRVNIGSRLSAISKSTDLFTTKYDYFLFLKCKNWKWNYDRVLYYLQFNFSTTNYISDVNSFSWTGSFQNSCTHESRFLFNKNLYHESFNWKSDYIDSNSKSNSKSSYIDHKYYKSAILETRWLKS